MNSPERPDADALAKMLKRLVHFCPKCIARDDAEKLLQRYYETN